MDKLRHQNPNFFANPSRALAIISSKSSFPASLFAPLTILPAPKTPWHQLRPIQILSFYFRPGEALTYFLDSREAAFFCQRLCLGTKKSLNHRVLLFIYYKFLLEIFTKKLICHTDRSLDVERSCHKFAHLRCCRGHFQLYRRF